MSSIKLSAKVYDQQMYGIKGIKAILQPIAGYETPLTIIQADGKCSHGHANGIGQQYRSGNHLAHQAPTHVIHGQDEQETAKTVVTLAAYHGNGYHHETQDPIEEIRTPQRWYINTEITQPKGKEHVLLVRVPTVCLY